MRKKLDPLLHNELRLSIMSLLVSLKKTDFTNIKNKTEATAGNISIQLQKLRDADYISVKKSFKNNYPLTECEITQKGINAFENYVNEIKKYINFD